MSLDRLMIVVPCYNEEEVLPDTAAQLLQVVYDLMEKKKISDDSGVLFVNDGSRDRTWELIEQQYHADSHIYGLNLAGNVGHQNALLAGLHTAQDICDLSISIDADLQDDIGVIEQMVDHYYAGADIVYGVRSERKTDSAFKRVTAQAFYKLMQALGAKTIYNHADYRLMSARAMRQLSQYKERNLFLRGIVPTIGYQTARVYYARRERTAGESKYPLKKMLAFAWDGITSFSVKPITLIAALGAFIIGCTVLAFLYTLASWASGHVVPGWSSLMISIWFLGGVQLFCIGMVGQYVGKIYVESKERPRYNIERFLDHTEHGRTGGQAH